MVGSEVETQMEAIVREMQGEEKKRRGGEGRRRRERGEKEYKCRRGLGGVTGEPWEVRGGGGRLELPIT